MEQPATVCQLSHFTCYLQETSEDTSRWLGLSLLDTGTPDNPLMPWNCSIDLRPAAAFAGQNLLAQGIYIVPWIGEDLGLWVSELVYVCLCGFTCVTGWCCITVSCMIWILQTLSTPTRSLNVTSGIHRTEWISKYTVSCAKTVSNQSGLCRAKTRTYAGAAVGKDHDMLRLNFQVKYTGKKFNSKILKNPDIHKHNQT